MERSDALIKLVAVIVFAAVMIYLGVSFVSGYRDPLRTVSATGMEKRDGLETEGYIVRDEQVITATGENVAVTVTDGAKVASGETLAVRYSGETAMERAQRISEIQLRIKQLTAIKNGRSGEELADETVLNLSSALSAGDMDAVYEIEQDVDAYIMSGTVLATGGEEEEIARLEEELKSLGQNSSSDTARVTAPWSGTFSSVTDGLEGIGPDSLEDLTVSEYRRLFSGGGSDESAVGKLVRGIRWYYATSIPEQSAKKLRAGGSAKLIFSRTYSAELTMRVDSISTPEDGECAVVFSCDKYMQDVAGIRDATAEIVFGTLSGISVPREAVHLNDKGESVVYILRGVTANEMGVNIIAESGDYYMVEKTRTGVRVNDLIIVRANSLYDGAVVER